MSNVPFFKTSKFFQARHEKTLSVYRIRKFIPWDHKPGTIVKIHPQKLHDFICCEKCNKDYSSYEGLKRHQKLGKCDSVKVNYICKTCNTEFKRADLRMLHMRLVHSDDKLELLSKCLICDQRCETKEVRKK